MTRDRRGAATLTGMSAIERERFAEPVVWTPEIPRIRPGHVLLSWTVAALAVAAAAALLSGFDLSHSLAAFAVAATIAVLNALLPPVIAALRLPFTVVAGFVLILLADAAV